MSLAFNKFQIKTIIVAMIATMIAANYLILRNFLTLKTNNQNPIPIVQGQTDLKIYTKDELSLYDGSDPNKPVLLGFDGYVYDVSPGRKDFYDKGQSYNYLVGRDSTKELIIVGGNIIKNKYQVVGKFQ
jgi:predicted heme/steroid binding protein